MQFVGHWLCACQDYDAIVFVGRLYYHTHATQAGRCQRPIPMCHKLHWELLWNCDTAPIRVFDGCARESQRPRQDPNGMKLPCAMDAQCDQL